MSVVFVYLRNICVQLLQTVDQFCGKDVLVDVDRKRMIYPELGKYVDYKYDQDNLTDASRHYDAPNVCYVCLEVHQEIKHCCDEYRGYQKTSVVPVHLVTDYISRMMQPGFATLDAFFLNIRCMLNGIFDIVSTKLQTSGKSAIFCCDCAAKYNVHPHDLEKASVPQHEYFIYEDKDSGNEKGTTDNVCVCGGKPYVAILADVDPLVKVARDITEFSCKVMPIQYRGNVKSDLDSLGLSGRKLESEVKRMNKCYKWLQSIKSTYRFILDVQYSTDMRDLFSESRDKYENEDSENRATVATGVRATHHDRELDEDMLNIKKEVSALLDKMDYVSKKYALTACYGEVIMEVIRQGGARLDAKVEVDSDDEE